MEWPEPEHGLRRAILEPGALARADQLFLEMGQSQAGGERHRQALATNKLERIILEIDMAQQSAGAIGIDERIRSVILTLQGRLNREISVADLARQAGLSESRFSHLFREDIGLSPMEYLEQARLDRARQLLLISDAPVSHIALQVGFMHPFHFSRRFKLRFKMSPTEFRRSGLQGDAKGS